MLDEVDVVLEVVGPEDGKNKRGRGNDPYKAGCRAHALDHAGGVRLTGRDGGGGQWVGVYMVVQGVGGG